MRLVKRLSNSLIKRLPGGRKFLQERHARNSLYQLCSENLFISLNEAKSDPNRVYVPAFERIFLLLNAFYKNGLRGDILEFGVYQGYTGRLFSRFIKRFKFEQTRLHLFDSFEGLPKSSREDQDSYEVANGIWSEGMFGVPKGMEKLLQASLAKKLGKKRVFVVKGFFEQTLETHIRESHLKKALLVHLDCDLYSSSKYVLRMLIEHDLLQDGSVIICDDWMCSFGNPHVGQRKAVGEILKEQPNWDFEPYFNYGLGSHVFVAHNKVL